MEDPNAAFDSLTTLLNQMGNDDWDVSPDNSRLIDALRDARDDLNDATSS